MDLDSRAIAVAVTSIVVAGREPRSHSAPQTAPIPRGRYASSPLRRRAAATTSWLASSVCISAERLGKPVVVENRVGADGIIGTEIAARATLDGHTLFMASAAFAMNPAVRRVPYDPGTAFSWIALLGSGNNVLVTHPSFHAKTVKEIVALGKAKPKYLNLAPAGGYQNFISEMFRQMAGIDLVVVLYKGGFPAMIDVISGQAHMSLSSLASAQPHVRAGKLLAIATTSATRSALFPELPTIAESGVPGYEAANYWVVASPARTPATIVRRVNSNHRVARLRNRAMGAAVETAETRQIGRRMAT